MVLEENPWQCYVQFMSNQMGCSLWGKQIYKATKLLYSLFFSEAASILKSSSNQTYF
jgi:hypothetical protein